MTSFKDNYPDLCEKRRLILVNCLDIGDSEHDSRLREHVGWHPEIMLVIAESEGFAADIKPLGLLDPIKDYLVVAVCRCGRRRSVGGATLMKHTLHKCFKSVDVARCHLAEVTRGKLCVAQHPSCAACDCTSPGTAAKRGQAFDASYNRISAICRLPLPRKPKKAIDKEMETTMWNTDVTPRSEGASTAPAPQSEGEESA